MPARPGERLNHVHPVITIVSVLSYYGTETKNKKIIYCMISFQ